MLLELIKLYKQYALTLNVYAHWHLNSIHNIPITIIPNYTNRYIQVIASC